MRASIRSESRRLSHSGSSVLARRGDGEEVLLAEIEQRRAKQGCKLQAVARIEHDVAERHEVENADVAGDLEPVGAGGGQALAVEGADQLAEQRAANLDEDQDVVGGDRALARTERPALGDPAPDLARDLFGDLAGRGLKPLVDLERPLGGVEHRVLLLDRRPERDGAAVLGARGLVDEVAFEYRGLLLGAGEHAIDGGEDAGQGAEADVQRHAVELHADLLRAQGVALAGAR